MLRFPFRAKNILCLGAHADDIEIGLGGTLLTLIHENPDINVRWVTFTAPGVRSDEARRSAEDFLARAQSHRIDVHEFRESFFPSEWERIKETFERIKSEFVPDVIFTHQRDDRHQDHRVLSDLAWSTFRNHLILEYEIFKYDGDLGVPSVFMPISAAVSDRKIELLLKNFPSQAHRHWFTRSTFEAIHRIRGVECAAESGFAEAFYCRKLTLSPS